MDWEKGLLKAVVREGYPAYAENVLPIDFLEPYARKAFEWVEKFCQDHDGKTPDLMTVEYLIEEKLNDVPDEPIEFWVKHIRRRTKNRLLRRAIAEAQEVMTDDPDKAESIIREVLTDLERGVGDSGKLIPVLNLEIWEEQLKRVEQGDIGIETIWPSINDRVGGLCKKDLILIAARPGVGKSFLLLMMLLGAWKQGHRILLASTEMSAEAMVMRTAALAAKVPYKKMKKNQLPSFERDAVRQMLAGWKDSGDRDRFMLIGDGFDVYLESIEAKMHSFKPDVLAIDGGYLLKSKIINDKDRMNRIAELFNAFKSLAKRHDIPVIVTTQLNRPPGQKGKTKAGLERMAFSDNAGMVADCIYILEQEDDDRQNKKMRIQPVKLREGDDLSEILLNWDFENQIFTESGHVDWAADAAPKDVVAPVKKKPQIAAVPSGRDLVLPIEDL